MVLCLPLYNSPLVCYLMFVRQIIADNIGDHTKGNPSQFAGQ